MLVGWAQGMGPGKVSLLWQETSQWSLYILHKVGLTLITRVMSSFLL